MAHEQQDGLGTSSAPTITHNNYYQGPVNNIGQVLNANFGANYGTFSQGTSQSSLYGPHPLLLPIPDASHTRNRRASPPDSNCLPGTRTKALEKIRLWAMDETFEDVSEDIVEEPWGAWGAWVARDAWEPYETPIPRSKHVLWLCGPVGCGKSAISQAVATEFEEKGLLLGSFFFFRGSGDRSRIARLIVTLASQMADAIPETRPLVEAALRGYWSFSLHAASPTIQFRRLICQPLQAVLSPTPAAGTSGENTLGKRSRSLIASRGPFLCIIDGFDECDDRDEVRELIDEILHFFERNPRFPLRFLIASRIEEHIRAHIEKVDVHRENLHDHKPGTDILALVRHTFQKAAEENLVIRSYGAHWPCARDIDKLVEHADGSFIFITTLLKYIMGGGQTRRDGTTPMERFQLALDMSHGLDGIYEEVLHRAELVPNFSEVVLSIAGLRQPLSIRGLACLLDIPAFNIVNVLVPLQSIILVPGDDITPVTVFHTSLREYILETGRFTDASSPECDSAETLLAHKCFLLRVKSDSHWDYNDKALEYARVYLSDTGVVCNLRRDVTKTSWSHNSKTRRYLTAPARDAFPGWSEAFSKVRDVWEMLRECSKGGHFLRNLQTVYQKPMPNPEPCMHRCIVMHCMRVLVGSASEEELFGFIYAMDAFTYHLSLGLQLSSDDDDDNILDFLQIPYTVPVERAGVFLRSHHCDFIPRTKTAFEAQHLVQAINTKFPGLVRPLTWTDIPSDPAPRTQCWGGKPCFVRSVQFDMPGLSVLDMLNVRRSAPAPT